MVSVSFIKTYLTHVGKLERWNTPLLIHYGTHLRGNLFTQFEHIFSFIEDLEEKVLQDVQLWNTTDELDLIMKFTEKALIQVQTWINDCFTSDKLKQWLARAGPAITGLENLVGASLYAQGNSDMTKMEMKYIDILICLQKARITWMFAFYVVLPALPFGHQIGGNNSSVSLLNNFVSQVVDKDFYLNGMISLPKFLASLPSEVSQIGNQFLEKFLGQHAVPLAIMVARLDKKKRASALRMIKACLSYAIESQKNSFVQRIYKLLLSNDDPRTKPLAKQIRKHLDEIMTHKTADNCGLDQPVCFQYVRFIHTTASMHYDGLNLDGLLQDLFRSEEIVSLLEDIAISKMIIDNAVPVFLNENSTPSQRRQAQSRLQLLVNDDEIKYCQSNRIYMLQLIVALRGESQAIRSVSDQSFCGLFPWIEEMPLFQKVDLPNISPRDFCLIFAGYHLLREQVNLLVIQTVPQRLNISPQLSSHQFSRLLLLAVYQAVLTSGAHFCFSPFSVVLTLVSFGICLFSGHSFTFAAARLL